jgi:2-dehydro-3-deoxyglucarate aldolase
MLKQKIKSGQLTLGSWITLGHPSIAEIFSKAKFDWLVVDLEHSTISIDQAGELIRVIDLAGVAPLVRLTSNNEDQIKRVMDAGAHGIVVPMVNNADDAAKAVAATRYAPVGTRGVGLARAQGYGFDFQEYLSWQSDSEDGPIVIVQIEHKDAVCNLEAILNTQGVDAFIVGPYDLSCSLGIPGQFNHPEFEQTMDQIIDIGNKMGAVSGLHVVEPDVKKLNNAIKSGYKFIAYSVDIRMLDVSARSAMNEISKR